MNKTLIIGVGSILRGDDGIGPRVIDEMAKGPLPPDVKIEAGDLSGMDLLKFFPDNRKVIIVDAADMALAPGTIRVFSPKDIKGSDFNDKFSTHGIGLLETLTLAGKLDMECEITIIGIQPENTDFNLEISDLIRSKIPGVVEQIKKLIPAFGLTLAASALPRTLRPWSRG